MKRDHTPLITASVIAVMATGVAWFTSSYRAERDYTEADLIADLKANTPDPVAEVDQSLDFDKENLTRKLQAEFLRISRRARPRLAACLERWEDPPAVATLRVQSDAAGRLEKIAIADAPEAVQACMLNILGDAQWPRNADGVVRFHSSERDAGWLGQPVAMDDTGDATEEDGDEAEAPGDEPAPAPDAEEASSGEPSPG